MSAKTIDISTLEFWTPREVANLLRCDPSTVTRWCTSGKIDAAQLPGGTWRIHKSVVDSIKAKGMPQVHQKSVEPGPEWESANDYFDDDAAAAKPKTRA